MLRAATSAFFKPVTYWQTVSNRLQSRIVIDKYGKVKHVHVISAFPDQAKAITDALLQWEFRPYKRNDEPVEVETGIMFGKAPMPWKTAANVKE
jgi:Gram-negative bacterial TonB protein C-terminal